MTAIIDEDNNKSKIVYDGVGNKIQTIDAENNIVDYYYDALKRLIRQTGQLGYNIDYIYGYDTTDNIATKEMLAERDNENIRRAKWWTDWQNNPVKQIDGQDDDEKTTSLSYDLYSRITSKITPNGDVISFGYDKLGHEKYITCDNDSSVNAMFTYNKIGQKTVMSDVTGTTRYYYDPAGRLTRKLDPKNYPVYYEYDKAGNKTKMTFTGINRPDDLKPDTADYPYVTQSVTYEYNKANQLTEIKSSYNSATGEKSKTTTFEYDSRSGMLLKKIYPDNSYVTYDYDKYDRLAELANYFDNDSLISSDEYFYNKLHNKTKIITNRQGEEFVSVYNYDAKNQLVKEFYKDNDGTPHRIEYVYDGTGNRQFLKDTSNRITTTYEYTVNNLNQLVALNNTQNTADELATLDIWGIYQGSRGNNEINIDSSEADYNDTDKLFYENDNDISATNFQVKENDSTVVTVELDNENDICYTYDDNGNLIYKSQNGISTSYEFDALNRLVRVYYTTADASGDPVIHKLRHFYNANGQRICTIDNDGSLTHYIYDGPISIAECDNTGKVNKQFIHGGGLAGDVGSLVYKEQLDSSQTDGVDTSYFFYNYRGDVIDVLSDNGTISYRYDAFGNVIHLSGDQVENSFLFSSKRFNEAIGLSYFEARYYDAFIGRFISRDPMGFIDGPNQYFYCMNNPLGYIDPFGTNKRALLEGIGREAIGIPRGIYDFFFEKGKYIPYEKLGIDYVGSPKSKTPRIYTNGILTSLDAAKRTTKELGADLYYNPSNGFLADVTQSALQKTLGRFVPGSLGAGYANKIKELGKLEAIELFSHSQGTITQTVALEHLNRQRQKFGFYADSRAIFMAPVTLQSRIDNISPKFPNLTTHIEVNQKDFVTQTLRTLNPVNYIQGWSNVFATGKEHSVQKTYIPLLRKKGII